MCFRFGEGAFEQSGIDANLVLAVSSADPRIVQPSRKMSLRDFQQALANTLHSWAVIEEEHRT